MSLFCTFVVDKYFFGVPVEVVQEVVRQQQMTLVPLARSEVRGLINLRGQIITALDLRCRLRLAPISAEARLMNVFIKTPEGAVSLLVDRVEDILEVPADSIERPPDTLQGELRNLIVGASKLQDRLLLVLNTNRALDLV
jgi:purine-binding chemotaxis protein CheW